MLGILQISINRPERRNAFRPHTVRGLIRACNDARDDPSVGVIILTGKVYLFCYCHFVLLFCKLGHVEARNGLIETCKSNHYHTACSPFTCYVT